MLKPIHVELLAKHALELLRVGRVADDLRAHVLVSLCLALEELPQVAQVRVGHACVSTFKTKLLGHPERAKKH